MLFYSDAPYEGGAERYLEYLALGFPTRWQVAIVARARRALDVWCDRLTALGVEVDRAPDSTRGLVRALWRSIRHRRPDVVHLNLPHSYAAQYTGVAPLARLAGARAVVTTEHLTMIDPMRLRGRIRAAMTRAVDRVITLSESNRRDLTERHGLRDATIRVVFNGVPDPAPVNEVDRLRVRRELGAADGEPLVVHLGALTARKGHRILFEALSPVRQPWRLAVVGEGEDEADLRHLAAHLGLADRVTFTGRRPDPERVLAASDLVVLPSSREGVPLVLLEAMAMGRAAVATDIYGIPEMYAGSDAALLVPRGDAPALTAALGTLLADPDRRAAMGRSARALYERRFTVDHMARATIDVYRETWR